MRECHMSDVVPVPEDSWLWLVVSRSPRGDLIMRKCYGETGVAEAHIDAASRSARGVPAFVLRCRGADLLGLYGEDDHEDA